MTFSEAVQACFSRYMVFEGRSRRAELWWFVLFAMLGNAVTAMADWALFWSGADVLNTVFGIAILLPMLAVGARRLHDIGRSGWWQLIGLIPILGMLVLIYWFIQPGDEQDNAFGANPLKA